MKFSTELYVSDKCEVIGYVLVVDLISTAISNKPINLEAEAIKSLPRQFG
jgi:hypothetical protein